MTATKRTRKPAAEPKRRGAPPKSPELRHVKRLVSFSPDVAAWLQKLADDGENVSRLVDEAVKAKMLRGTE